MLSWGGLWLQTAKTRDVRRFSTIDDDDPSLEHEIGVLLGDPQFKNLHQLAALWECNATEAIQRVLSIQPQWLVHFVDQMQKGNKLPILVSLPPTVRSVIEKQAYAFNISLTESLLQHLRRNLDLRPHFAADGLAGMYQP